MKVGDLIHYLSNEDPNAECEALMCDRQDDIDLREPVGRVLVEPGKVILDVRPDWIIKERG